MTHLFLERLIFGGLREILFSSLPPQPPALHHPARLAFQSCPALRPRAAVARCPPSPSAQASAEARPPLRRSRGRPLRVCRCRSTHRQRTVRIVLRQQHTLEASHSPPSPPALRPRSAARCPLSQSAAQAEARPPRPQGRPRRGWRRRPTPLLLLLP